MLTELQKTLKIVGNDVYPVRLCDIERGKIRIVECPVIILGTRLRHQLSTNKTMIQMQEYMLRNLQETRAHA